MTNTATVTRLPECDIHKYDMNTPGVPAAYDAKTKRGPWASMCTPCWEDNRYFPGLGLGKGQRYVLVNADGTTPARP